MLITTRVIVLILSGLMLLGENGFCSQMGCYEEHIEIDTIGKGVVVVRRFDDLSDKIYRKEGRNNPRTWIDTLSVSSCMDSLLKIFKKSKFVFVGRIDTVVGFEQKASISSIQSDGKREDIEFSVYPESVRVVVDTVLKGEIGSGFIWTIHEGCLFCPVPKPKRVVSLSGKTFVAFSDSLRTTEDLGIKPAVTTTSAPGKIKICKREEGFFIVDSVIVTNMFPGISISYRDFLQGIERVKRKGAEND